MKDSSKDAFNPYPNSCDNTNTSEITKPDLEKKWVFRNKAQILGSWKPEERFGAVPVQRVFVSLQLLRALGQLVLDNLEVQRWLFKVDDERGGNGTAFCDVISHLECYPWIQREQRGHGPGVWRESQARVSNKITPSLLSRLFPFLPRFLLARILEPSFEGKCWYPSFTKQ